MYAQSDKLIGYNNQVFYGSCYEFVYERTPLGQPNAYSWRVARVKLVNSYGTVLKEDDSEYNDRFPICEVEYNATSGVVSRLNFLDTHGNVMLRHVLSERNGVPGCVADFIDAKEQIGTTSIGALTTSVSVTDISQPRSNIVRFVYERDSAGHIVKQTYHSSNDYQLSRSAVSDGDGIYGQSFHLQWFGPNGECVLL